VPRRVHDIEPQARLDVGIDGVVVAVERDVARERRPRLPRVAVAADAETLAVEHQQFGAKVRQRTALFEPEVLLEIDVGTGDYRPAGGHPRIDGRIEVAERDAGAVERLGHLRERRLREREQRGRDGTTTVLP